MYVKYNGQNYKIDFSVKFAEPSTSVVKTVAEQQIEDMEARRRQQLARIMANKTRFLILWN